MSYHSFARKKVTANSPMEQLLLTNDLTDYLLYETTFQLDNEEDEENWNGELFLTITSCDANGLIVFLDGKFVAEKSLGFPGGNCTRQFQFQLPSSSSSPSLFVQEHKSKKKHFLQVMSVQLGIFCLDSNHTKGITGKIELNGKKNLAKNHVWNMYPGLVGEQLEIFKPIWKQSVPWKKVIIDNKNNKNISTKFTWFATSFKKSDFYIDAFKKTGDKKYHRVEQVFSILLDAFGMTRGRAFLNGHDLGRIWLEKNAKGEFIQRYYHLPMDWLEEKKENFLVVFDELGGTIEHVRLVLSHMIEQPLSSSILIPLEEEKEISSHIFLTDE
jgi:hypothetical protein